MGTRLTTTILALAALFGLSFAAQASADDVETLRPVEVTEHAVAFEVAGIEPESIVAANAHLKARRHVVRRVLARRYDGHRAARHRARRRMRRHLHRQVEVARVQEAAFTGERLTLSKPSYARSGKLNVRSGAGPGSSKLDTTITSGPSGTISSSSASFAFTGSQADASFECSFDGGAFSACTSPTDYTSLVDGNHAFSVRAKDVAGNVDSTPASRSFKVSTAPPAPTGPPSGTIVQADYMTRACPIDNLWGAVSDADYFTTSCSSWSDAGDSQIDYSASGGSPLPGQDGQVHPGFRRLRLTDGQQSIYDATCASGSPCNRSYRTQAISNSDISAYYPMRPGHRYVWWMSVRFQNSTPLTGDTASDDSQIWQIKNQGTTCHPDGTYAPGPIESMTETKNTIRLISRQRDGDLRNDVLPIGPRGVWQTFAFDVYYTNDPSKAAYRLWGDQDGDSQLELVPLTPKITGRVTAVGTDCIGKPSIGPYQPMDVPAVNRDYGTNEMVEVPVGASWG